MFKKSYSGIKKRFQYANFDQAKAHYERNIQFEKKTIFPFSIGQILKNDPHWFLKVLLLSRRAVKRLSKTQNVYMFIFKSAFWRHDVKGYSYLYYERKKNEILIVRKQNAIALSNKRWTNSNDGPAVMREDNWQTLAHFVHFRVFWLS